MITKLKSKGFFLSSTLALGVAAGVGIATAPAQAVGFTSPLSTLDWEDATSDFNGDVDFTAGDTFSVTFATPAGLVSNFIATGDFDPFFDPPALVPSSSPTGDFTIIDATIGVSIPPGAVAAAEYTLDDDLVFSFNTTAQGNGSPVTATLEGGSTFFGFEEANGAKEFNLVSGEWMFQLPDNTSTPEIDPKMQTARDSVFEFGDLVGTDGGTFDAEGEVVHATAPEPATILGLLAVGGLGLGLKRKK